jgi:SAM-dependent methyltransferase
MARSMAISPAYFEAMFAANDDPWSFRSRWYETRKRAMTLASLPRARYHQAYEPGCANGELSADLAARCDRLLISDGTPRAVDIARERVSRLANVEVIEAWVPNDWPRERFDLLVISELGYFLSPDALDELIGKVRGSLKPGGTVLACHWRRPIEGCAMNGDEVQARIGELLGLTSLTRVVDADFLLEVWSLAEQSVAQHENIP